MDVRALFERVKPIFEKHRNEKHVEFEMRVGKFNCGTFDTNVGKASPLGMNRGLNSLWKKGGILYAPPMW